MRWTKLFYIFVASVIIVIASYRMHKTGNTETYFTRVASPIQTIENRPIIVKPVLSYGGKQRNTQKSGRTQYIFNASSIRNINIIRYLSNGTHKMAFLGEYRGRKVVVKMTVTNTKVNHCIKQRDVDKPGFLTTLCINHTRTNAMVREIYLLHHLRHPNIADMLGYCFNCEIPHGNTSLFRSIMIVTEYGEEIRNRTSLQYLEHVLQVTRLFHFLEHSPFGSLRYDDVKLEHFVLINSQVSMIDIDKLYESNVSCSKDGECMYSVECDRDTNICPGFNARSNMVLLYRKVFLVWLEPSTFPESVRASVVSLLADIASGTLDMAEIGYRIKTIMEDCRLVNQTAV